MGVATGILNVIATSKVTGEGIPGTKVVVDGLELPAVIDGIFRRTDVQMNVPLTLTVSAPGYETKTQSVTLLVSPTTLNVTLEPAPPPKEELPPPQGGELPWPLNVVVDWLRPILAPIQDAINGFKPWVEGQFAGLKTAIEGAPDFLFRGVFKIVEAWTDEFNRGFEKGLEE
jgi:hypothetical protein